MQPKTPKLVDLLLLVDFGCGSAKPKPTQEEVGFDPSCSLLLDEVDAATLF